jgi:hypothetical protein
VAPAARELHLQWKTFFNRLGMRSRAQRSQLARRIAVEAARLAVDGKRADLAFLRRKAAKQLGCSDPKSWPDLALIEGALREQQRLFRGKEQVDALARLRRHAVAAMRMLDRFQPRLTGPVLDGTADEHSSIRVMLTVDEPEAVMRELLDRQIPWRAGEARLRWSRGRLASRPYLLLFLDDAEIELVLLSENDRNDPPFADDGRAPMRTASLSQLLELSEAPGSNLASGP